MQKRTEVKVFKTELLCDACKVEMKRLPYALMSAPPQYDYECPECKEKIRTTKVYPTLEYIEIEE